MKKIVMIISLSLLVVIMMCSCSDNSNTVTTPVVSSTAATSSQGTVVTTETPVTTTQIQVQTTTQTSSEATTAILPPVVNVINPYVNVSFNNGAINDLCGNATVKLDSRNESEVGLPEVKSTNVTFKGESSVVDSIVINKKGQHGTIVLDKVAPNQMNDWVAENGGITLEVLYLDNSTTGATVGIVCCTNRDTVGNAPSGWGLAQTAKRLPYFCTGDGKAYISTYAGEVSTKELVHVVCVFDSDEGFQSIYVNGKFVSKNEISAFYAPQNTTDFEGLNMANILFIGGDPATGAAIDFGADNLIVSGIKIYDKALSVEEVSEIYESVSIK